MLGGFYWYFIDKFSILWDNASLDFTTLFQGVGKRDFLSLAGKSDAIDKADVPKEARKMRSFRYRFHFDYFSKCVTRSKNLSTPSQFYFNIPWLLSVFFKTVCIWIYLEVPGFLPTHIYLSVEAGYPVTKSVWNWWLLCTAVKVRHSFGGSIVRNLLYYEHFVHVKPPPLNI